MSNCDGPSFGQWLAETKFVQRTIFNNVFPAFNPDDATSLERRRQMMEANLLGLLAEAGEVAQEFGWKSWKKSSVGTVNRDRALAELVDVMHFVANLLVILNVSGQELGEAYAEKLDENIRRQKEGY
jgi:NTP pyrophosphatase (non-canonical NTP hydrolase)